MTKYLLPNSCSNRHLEIKDQLVKNETGKQNHFPVSLMANKLLLQHL